MHWYSWCLLIHLIKALAGVNVCSLSQRTPRSAPPPVLCCFSMTGEDPASNAASWTDVQNLVSLLSLGGFERRFAWRDTLNHGPGTIFHGCFLVLSYLLLLWQAALWAVAVFNSETELEIVGPVGGSAVLWLTSGLTVVVSESLSHDLHSPSSLASRRSSCP